MNDEYKVLYLCSTNYTILNCVNSAMHNFSNYKTKPDIVVFLRNNDMIPYIQNLKKMDVFENVYVYSFINYTSIFNKAKIVLQPKAFLKHFEVKPFDYILFNGTNDYTTIITQSLFYSMIFKRVFKNANVYMIEEGISSYTSRTVNSERRSIAYELLNKLLFRGYANNIEGQFLYEKEMYIHKDDESHIYSLPKIGATELNFYKKIFGSKTNVLYQTNNVTYLGTPLFGLRGLLNKPEECNDDFELECSHILKKTFEAFGNTNVVYRKHPLEQSVTCFDRTNIKIDLDNNMWEMEAYSFAEKGKMLVSFFSTASLTPKLLYDREPYLLFLYKLVNYSFYNAEKVIECVKECYVYPERILVPESYEELVSMVNKWRGGE